MSGLPISNNGRPPGRPPFRAEHVGSLLRPANVVSARAEYKAGKLSATELNAIEHAEISYAVRRQEELGFRAVTDGEYRRSAWQWDFLEGLKGTAAYSGAVAGGDATAAPKIIRVTGKLGFGTHPMLEHFRLLKSISTQSLPKMTIPSPTMLVSAMRDWRAIVDASIYSNLEEFYSDLAAAYRTAIGAFYSLGCRYIQFDDCNLAYLCDPECRERIVARGDNPDQMLADWIGVINSATAGRPHDLFVATHICHGNFRSRWFSQGGYEPIAELIFGRLGYDAFFLEYDSARSGGFEPLRFLPADGSKSVVLGLITTKTGQLESEDALVRRIEEAGQFTPIENLCLSPQCGFASTEEGNELTIESQWKKLELVARVARRVWSD